MKSPAPDHIYTSRPNRKGQGFHLFKKPDADLHIKKLKKQLILGGTAVTFGTLGLLVLVGKHSTPDFMILVVSMVALCGMIAYDIVTRRYWEQKLAHKVEELCRNHDRLTREVARNRSDIAILKEGLGEMALSVEAQGRKLTPTGSAEAKMIETIVTSLGALGDKPRAEIETGYDSDILELEMAPPPKKPEPISEYDAESDPDFAKYSDTVVAELVRHAVRNDAIDIFMQPIVALPSRKLTMFETYARIRAGNGVYIPARRYLDMANKEELLPAIDNALLLRCLQMLRSRKAQDSDASYVLNISSRTLNDRKFMSELIAFLSQDRKMASRLIFELSQNELETHATDLSPLLDGLAKLGCTFSMDRVRTRRIDMNVLKSLHIRYIKLDASWLISEGASNTGFSRIIRMKKQLDAAGIDMVIEHIETENSLRELLDFNIDYGQGYLFGKPDHQAAYLEKTAAA